MLMTAAQFRAARALIGASQAAVAKAIEVSEQTIKRMENDNIGPGKSKAETTIRAREYFEGEGIVFLDEGDGFQSGVALRVVEDAA